MYPNKDLDLASILGSLLFSFAFSSFAANAGQTVFKWKGEAIETTIGHDSVISKKNGSLILNLKIEAPGDVKIADFNFDGYPDISVPRDHGIEKYYDIYLFQESSASFKIDEKLSELACPELNEKARTISSSCNHASACEAWKDTYRFEKKSIVLIRRDGVNCDPNSGEEFRYVEIYKNGRLVKNQSTMLKN